MKTYNEEERVDTVICYKCKASLPNDSEFCQVCGTKLSSAFLQKCMQRNDKDKELLSENESERFTEIQQERHLAIQKRIATIELTNKRNKKKKTVLFSFIVIVVAIFVIKGICDNVHRAKLRNFATETMDASFTNVYADVVSITPQYFVYRYSTTKYGTKIGEESLSEVVCRCKTVEGKLIWASFFYQYFPEGYSSTNEGKYKSFLFESSNPMRLVGGVDTARQVNYELANSIGNVLVLDVREKPKKCDE